MPGEEAWKGSAVRRLKGYVRRLNYSSSFFNHVLPCLTQGTTGKLKYQRFPSLILVLVYLKVWYKASDLGSLGQLSTDNRMSEKQI